MPETELINARRMLNGVIVILKPLIISIIIEATALLYNENTRVAFVSLP